MAKAVYVLINALALIAPITTVPDLSTLCPYTQYCTKGPLITENGQKSCCRQCSCNDLCGLVGTCCPDKEPPNTIHELYPCKTQEEIYFNYLNVSNSPKRNTDKFRVVTACHAQMPADSMDNNFEQHVARCSKAQSLEDLVFVTGKISGVTFINKHCAICNGETEYTEWVITMTKQQILQDSSTFEELEKYLLAEGKVLSLPTKMSDIESTVCPPYNHHTCNSTRLMQYESIELKEKCKENGQNFLYAKYNNAYEVFNNAYCYLCNLPNSTAIEHNCRNNVKKNVFRFSSYDEKSIRQDGFMALIRMSTKEDKSTTNRCDEDELFEEVQQRCVKLFCPPGYVPFNGRCKELFGDVSGYALNVYFRFPASEYIDTSETGIRRLMNEFESHVKDFIEDKQTTCSICQSRIGQFSTGEYVFWTTISSSPRCSHLYYLKRLSELVENGPFQVFSNSLMTNISLTVTSDTSFISNPILAWDVFQCRVFWDFSPTVVYCPSLFMSVPDIQAMRIQTYLKEQIILYSTPVGNNTVKLCLKDYRRILASSVSCSTCSVFVIFVSILFHVLHVLCV